MDKKKRTRERIVAEYLASGKSYRELAEETGINFRTIHRWVLESGMERPREEFGVPMTVGKIKGAGRGVAGVEDAMPEDVKQLQAELRKARLHNKLLNAMIDIAEDQMGVSIRKKPGAKR